MKTSLIDDLEKDENRNNNFNELDLISNALPRKFDQIKIPPIKSQGIKSNLVEFISLNLKWEGIGTCFEPFM